MSRCLCGRYAFARQVRQASEPKMKLRIGVLLFPKFEELDFAGPFEVFGMAAKYIDQEWSVFTVGEEPVVKGFLGAAIQVDHLFADAPEPDIIVVPGGFGTRPGVKN